MTDLDDLVLSKWRRRARRQGLPVEPGLTVARQYFKNDPTRWIAIIERPASSEMAREETYVVAYYLVEGGRVRYNGRAASIIVASKIKTMLRGCPDAMVFRRPSLSEHKRPDVWDQLHVFWSWAARIPLPRRMDGIRIHVHEHETPFVNDRMLSPNPDIRIAVCFPSAHTRGVLGCQEAPEAIHLIHVGGNMFSGYWLTRWGEPGKFSRAEHATLSHNDAAFLSALIPSARIVEKEGEESRLIVDNRDFVLLRLVGSAEPIPRLAFS